MALKKTARVSGDELVTNADEAPEFPRERGLS
jgi:hypothetical protein